jgi:hypothetical protein
MSATKDHQWKDSGQYVYSDIWWHIAANPAIKKKIFAKSEHNPSRNTSNFTKGRRYVHVSNAFCQSNAMDSVQLAVETKHNGG